MRAQRRRTSIAALLFFLASACVPPKIPDPGDESDAGTDAANHGDAAPDTSPTGDAGTGGADAATTSGTTADDDGGGGTGTTDGSGNTGGTGPTGNTGTTAGSTSGLDGGSGTAGSDAAADAAAALSVTTTSLPMATFNRPYQANLVAGGGKPPFSWTVTGGMLPQGLTLSSTGQVSGTPAQDGDFSFETTVVDSAGGTAKSQISVRVKQSRWLAYVSDEASIGTPALYLVDLSTSAYAKTAVTLPSGASVDQVAFSSDGRWLAYTTVTAGASYRLYAMDVSGKTPGASIPLGDTGAFTSFEWAPTAEVLAFNRAVPSDGGVPDSNDYFVDLSSAPPSAPLLIAGAKQGAWASDDVYVFQSNGQLAYTTRNGDNFSSSRILSVPYGSHFIDAALPLESRAHLIAHGGSCSTTNSSYIVDFRQPSILTLKGPSTVSYDFTWATLPSSDGSQTEIVRVQDLPSDTPRGTIGAIGCAVFSWAHHSAAVLWTNPVDDPAMHVSTFSDTVIKTNVITGNYSGGAVQSSFRFSSDDRWITFDTDDGSGKYAALSGIGGTSGAAVRISDLGSSSFSPDSKALTITSQDRIVFVDLHTNTPTPYDVTTTKYQLFDAPLWSSDGKYFAYKASSSSGSGSVPGIFIVNAAIASDEGTAITPDLVCTGGGACPRVATIVFQP